MDYAFKKLIGKIIEIYQDDLTVFSKERSNHVGHLRQIFERCRKYGISLNPAKLGIEEGKLLGHIINKDDVKVDLERVEAIRKIPLPKNVKVLQSFNGHINFIRKFIANLAELMKPMQALRKMQSLCGPVKEGKPLIL